MVAPVGAEIADDDQVFIDDRGVDATAVAGDAPVFLGQRARPYYVAVAVETEEIAADAVGVDIAGLGIAGQRRPADAVEGNGGVENAVGVLPDFGPGFRVEGRDHALLHNVRAAAADDKDSAIEYHRRGAAGEVGAPDEVFARGRPGRDEVGLRGDACLGWTAPGGPVGGMGGGDIEQKTEKSGRDLHGGLDHCRPALG